MLKFILELIVVLLIVVAVAMCIWHAISPILKIIIGILIIAGIFRVFKKGVVSK